MSVALEHVFPERFDFVNMAAFAVHRNTRQKEAFCEGALKADLLSEGALGFLRFVFAQPQGAGQVYTLLLIRR